MKNTYQRAVTEREILEICRQTTSLQSLKESGQNNIVAVWCFQQAGVLIIPFLCRITFGKP